MAVTNYIWHRNSVVAETDDQGAVTASYNREPNEPRSLISEQRGAQTRVHHYDAQGSTTELTDNNEVVTDTFRYSAFGNEVTRTGNTKTPYAWAGRTGIRKSIQKQFSICKRTYQSTVGRFLSTEPVYLTNSVNNYSAFQNNPISALRLDRCTIARRIIERQIADWRALGHNLSADLLEVFLNDGTKGKVHDMSRHCSKLGAYPQFFSSIVLPNFSAPCT